VTILVNNNITTGPKKFDVKAYANSTVWELRAAIAKHCKVTPDRVRLHKGGEVRGGFPLSRCRLWRRCVACSCVGDCVCVSLANAWVTKLSTFVVGDMPVIRTLLCGPACVVTCEMCAFLLLWRLVRTHS
jgi:hypothetical protein